MVRREKGTPGSMGDGEHGRGRGQEGAEQGRHKMKGGRPKNKQIGRSRRGWQSRKNDMGEVEEREEGARHGERISKVLLAG